MDKYPTVLYNRRVYLEHLSGAGRTMVRITLSVDKVLARFTRRETASRDVLTVFEPSRVTIFLPRLINANFCRLLL